MAQPVLLAGLNQNRSRETECANPRGQRNDQNGGEGNTPLCNNGRTTSGLGVPAARRDLDPLQVSDVHSLLLLEGEHCKGLSP
jgi:hypothetical protein